MRHNFPHSVHPVSLRVKLLIGFSVLFSIVFAGSFYWFYTFTTDKIMSRLRSEMRATLIGAVQGVDTEELIALYQSGQPNAQGFSDDPRYQNQLRWFELVHQIEPRAWLYSVVIGDPAHNRRIGAPAVRLGQVEAIYVVDLWANRDPSKAAKFLESVQAGSTARRAFDENQLMEEPEIYTDAWGSWLSAFAPLHDDEGNVVALLGLDIEADYVFQVQQAIRSRVLIAFIIAYLILFVLIYVLSGLLTQRLRELTYFAERIGAGRYAINLSWFTQSRFPDEMNTLAQVFSSMVDSIRTREHLIREGKKAEDEMRLALQQEREINELKSRFVSMVSHELRTPLTVIRTSLELLEQYGDVLSAEKEQEYFRRGRAAVHNMVHLLEDVLTLGKAEAGKLEFNPVLLNPTKFCRELVEEMRLQVGTEDRLGFGFEKECTEACLDPKLLRSILTNLLSNAIKYSSADSKVEFEVSCQPDVVVFKISDRGIGIPQQDQTQLFDLFHRASNVNTIRGTGLGLAIVKQCVAHHGGQVTFTSQEGVGTTFVVCLPLRPFIPEPPTQDKMADQPAPPD